MRRSTRLAFSASLGRAILPPGKSSGDVMSAGQYLFSFSGRINRAKAWLFVLISIVFALVAVVAIFMVIGAGALTLAGQDKAAAAAAFAAPAVLAVSGIFGLGYFVMLWCGLAVAAKRLHDRDKSAWWLVVFYLVPILLDIVALGMTMASAHANPGGTPNPMGAVINLVALGISLWGFVEIYCLRGTDGPNQYGPDPLAGQV